MLSKEYWASDLPRPLSPSTEDYITFKENMVPGTTLLLGCTRKLIELSDFQMDLDPWYDADSVIVQDWATNEVYYDNIIGDGVFNFTKELENNIINMSKNKCSKLIIRTFDEKMDIMRIADNFPNESDFIIKPTSVIRCLKYTFYIWEFNQKQ